MKEFQHHGAHASEKPWPEFTFKNVRQCGVGQDFEGLGLGVEFGFIRGKQHITPKRTQLIAIAVESARITGEIFVGQKLQAVDKNAGNSHVTQWLGHAH